MTPEHYQRVVGIFQTASDLSAAARPAFLAEACAGDDNLRREVEAMLAADAQSSGFLDKPPDDLAAAVAGRETRSLIGHRISHYEVVSLLGAGGMGEVYRAKDTRLGREVAIKFTNTSFSDRFEREARTIAALNHPNICTLHDVGPNYLVMELVEGPTLADRIKRGALPLEEVLSIARQIADALEAAHEKGIVHRDLKPGNIKIKPDGTVKVLDFGLAKQIDGREGAGTTMTATGQGVILGTAAYMSPEQARGNHTDRRADIWAFGVVLYEMLTGRQAFTGDTITDVLAAVVKTELDWTPAPERTQRLLRKCLEKDPERRLRHVGDFELLLEQGSQAPGTNHRRILPWAVAGVLAAAVLVLALGYLRRTRTDAPVLRLSIAPPDGATFNSYPAVSPDGRHLALVATTDGLNRLWVRDLDSLSAHLLAGTEGAAHPFWSPDSRHIAFFADKKLKKMDLVGGPAVSICDTGLLPLVGSWSRNGVIVFNSDGVLSRVSAAGGRATELVVADPASSEIRPVFPWFLPDGHHFLYTVVSPQPEKAGIYVGDLDSKTPRKIVNTLSNAAYAPPGYLVFRREQTLMAQPFDAATVQTIGDAFPIAQQIDYDPPRLNFGRFSLSGNGVLAYISGNVREQQLTWFDRSGNTIGTLGDPGGIGLQEISPDGSKVAVPRFDAKTSKWDIWLYNLTGGGGAPYRFSFNLLNNDDPEWSPDGKRLAFESGPSYGPFKVYQKIVDGSAQEEVLDESVDADLLDWSHDGRYILELRSDPKTKSDLWVLPLFGDRKPFPYLHGEFDENMAKLSPDDRWVAYFSDETSRREIYVQSFPIPGHKYQVSVNGGYVPSWSADGKELFFTTPDQKLMAVKVKTGEKFEAGVPKFLFQAHIGSNNIPWYNVSKDGRFLMAVPVGQSVSPPITVVVNWTEGLKK
jgi:Tol biopolymer transport system component